MLLHVPKKEKRKSKLLVHLALEELEGSQLILLLEEGLHETAKTRLWVNLGALLAQAVLRAVPLMAITHP